MLGLAGWLRQKLGAGQVSGLVPPVSGFLAKVCSEFEAFVLCGKRRGLAPWLNVLCCV